jgi:hypothetical protein
LSGNFDAVKILSKKERRPHERDLRRSVASFVGRRVNLALRDGSVICNVFWSCLPVSVFLGIG